MTISNLNPQQTIPDKQQTMADVLKPDVILHWANELYHGGNPEVPNTKKIENSQPIATSDLSPESYGKAKSNPSDIASVQSISGPSPEYYFLSKTQNQDSEEVPPSSNESKGTLALRKDFPILNQKVNGKPLIWFDNAATTQKPQTVIDSLNEFYSGYNSNVHRATHTLAKQATSAFEKAREKVQQFLGASSAEEIIFLRGTTEAINLVAQTWGRMNVHPGDEILISQMEHHSNIVPWQMLRQEKKAVIKIIPINDRGEILLDEYKKLFSLRTRMVAITHVSNVLGTVNPLTEMIQIAHSHRIPVLVDGAQGVPHFPVDVKSLDADFYVFSGHKIYGPTGIGALYGKRALLEAMPPWQGGGSMIKHVTFNNTTYNNIPYKFEAGTNNIADAIALGTAIDYLQKIGLHHIEQHERKLTDYAMESLLKIPGLCLIGTPQNKISVLSFIMRSFTPDEVAHHLEEEGIAVRTGHHCAQPTLERYGLIESVRVSLGLYNTKEEVDILCQVLNKLAKQSRSF
jgi:cysteine desulfurase/selenocysteine lyase